jgi:PAS domain S-box-containing protein
MNERARSPQLLDRESEIVRVLAEAATVDDATHEILAVLAAWFDWDVAMLWVPDDELGLLRCGPSWSGDDPRLVEFLRVSERLTLPRGVGLPGRVWSAAEPRWVGEIAEDPDFPRASVAAEAGLHSATAIPVVGRDGVFGVIELLSRTVRVADTEHELALSTVGRQLAHYVARIRAEERLRETEERATAIFEAALDCVITMDHEGLVVDFNPAAETTFGYSREQAVGRPLADLIVPPELRPAHVAGLRRYLATREPQIMNRRLELDGVRADGTSFPVELTVTRVGRREPPLFAGFLRDITQRHRDEAERRRLVKEAVAARSSEEAARVRAEFARHEAELERTRLEFLADIGLRMAASMDYSTTLDGVAHAAVPAIADLCVVTVIEPDGRPAPVAIVHADPERERAARELLGAHVAAPAPLPGMADVMRTGEYELLPEITEELIAATTQDDEQRRLLRALALRSSLTIPMKASGRVLGVIALGFADSGRSFESDDLVVATALAARAGLHIDNARLYTERSGIAETLQQSLLPPVLPTIPNLEVAARYRAAGDQNEVGGDFYDMFPSGRGVWTAVIGDVSGKGAKAAALTALTRHTLYAAALRDDSPARNLAFLDQAMRGRAHGAVAFSTVIYARVCPSPDSTALTLASGGHPPPMILRSDGRVELVETSGTLVGALETARFEEREARLRPGELLLLYTDGAVELRRRDLSFGERALAAVLREHAGESAEQVIDAVARRIEELQDGSPRDDVALLALRAVAGG